ncbi:phage tail tube protein, partial [Streptococcus pseudopneumoniae]|uniref:phage tail tube protein n=1 Tax=Streptococcus pseudopneumoniae TaxID=257758 RepID=UPI0019D699BA
ISLSWDNGLDSEGFDFGGAGSRSRKQALGKGTLTGSMTVEYDSNTLRDAWLAETQLAVVLRFQTTTAIAASNFPTLEITIPVVRLEGDIPA